MYKTKTCDVENCCQTSSKKIRIEIIVDENNICNVERVNTVTNLCKEHYKLITSQLKYIKDIKVSIT